MKKLSHPVSHCSFLQSTGLVLMLLTGFPVAGAPADPFTRREPPPIVGRWDLKVFESDREYPSWLEIQLSGYRSLVGAYVGRSGSVRPIGKIDYDDNSGVLRFVLPPQWERRTNDIVFEGKLEGALLAGETTNDQGQTIRWQGRPAPTLKRREPPKWGKPIELFNGRDLAGWKMRGSAATNSWRARDGLLVNLGRGNDLLTERQFDDFKLQLEFRYPKGSNSGLYLRGRYEVQIEDNHGLEPDSHRIGGVYGFLTPRVNPAKPAGEWQMLEVTLVGRVVTIVLNGEPIIERQAIPGITGGALDSDEEKPGPILLQGDHGPVEFRKLSLTPGA